MRILHVVGARPNFMKVAPIIAAFEAYRTREGALPIEQTLVHTGQHYDRAMSDLFFEELALPRPDINLDVGSGGHGEQTGRIMERFEPILHDRRPDLVMVVGDVNSTLACAIDAKKLGVAVGHVEAGLRSGDWQMPEEINRIATDAISDLLFATDRIACANMRKEGAGEDRIRLVGNVMIDTLLKHRARAMKLPVLERFGLTRGHFALVTLHRPSNVEEPEVLRDIGDALAHLGGRMPVIFPVHPRTRGRITRFGLDRLFSRENAILLEEPQGYLEFLNLMANAAIVLTDSGGVQEETTILGVPCLTLRHNTERPITVEQGTNRVVGNDRDAIIEAVERVLQEGAPPTGAPELWDGHAAERIVTEVVEWQQRLTRE